MQTNGSAAFPGRCSRSRVGQDVGRVKIDQGVESGMRELSTEL